MDLKLNEWINSLIRTLLRKHLSDNLILGLFPSADVVIDDVIKLSMISRIRHFDLRGKLMCTNLDMPNYRYIPYKGFSNNEVHVGLPMKYGFCIPSL